MLLGTPNEPLVLSLIAGDGRIDLFGRAKVYDSLGVLISTIDLTHVAEGLYTTSYTPTTEGYYTVVYDFFFDAIRTIPAGYEKQGETLDVNSIRINILRLLGLVHENSVVDLHVYDLDENLTGARIRVYDSAVNATAAAAISPASYTTGLRFTYEVHAVYTASLLEKYYITRLL